MQVYIEQHTVSVWRVVMARSGPYQMGVVLLMILPELGGHGYNNGAVGGNCKGFVPERFLEREEVTDLMLC